MSKNALLHRSAALRRQVLRTILPIALGAAGPVGAVPPPPVQVAANCESPTYASDVQVCDDPRLLALDARMRDVWAELDFARVVAPDAWVEAQEDWFRRRSLCAFSERHTECLRSAYGERIAVLEAMRLVASRPSRRGTAAVCRGAPWGGGSVRLRAPATGALTIEDSDARVLAAATPLQPGGVWSPHVGFTVEGPSIRLVPLTGSPVVCSPDETR